MTASALKFYGFDVDTDEQNRIVRRLNFQGAGRTLSRYGFWSQPSRLRLHQGRCQPFSPFDGSSLRAPSPIGLRAWRAIPTSAGKTFEWEGLVLKFKTPVFSAPSQHKGAKAEYEEIAQFDLVDVPPGDRVAASGVFGGWSAWGRGLNPSTLLAHCFPAFLLGLAGPSKSRTSSRLLFLVSVDQE
jgi:hypothetical protein